MENKQLQKTKRKLSIIFTIMIFFLVFILGFSYFFYKYFSEKNFDIKTFKGFLSLVERREIIKNDIIQKPKNIGNKRKIDREISYILFGKNNKILDFDIRFEPSENFLEEILNIKNKNQFGKIFFVQNFLVGFSGDFVFIKHFSYSFSKFFADILGFLVLNFLFSSIFYIVGLKFIEKTFIPIEQNISEMKNFVHNAGHELKTPISVIDSNIQLLLETKVYDEDMILELKDEVLRINSLLDSLINLSDIGKFSEKEENNLSEVIDEILKNFSKKILEKNILVSKNIPKDIFILANRNYFYIFLSNIIGNAIKYNEIGGKIFLNYKNGLIIEDSGVGISNENILKIFDRFFKVDKSRNSEGFGIGLSLVQKISNIYNWKIKVESSEGKGTKFFVKF